MKKVLNTATIIIAPFAVNAQNNNSFKVDERSFNLIAPLFLIGCLMVFIYAILKQFFNSRLKNKIVDKGVNESVAASLLRINPKENSNLALKLFVILMGTGIGLTIIHYTLPFGYHSLAIMAFSLAASFLGYYLFTNKHNH